MDYTVKLKLEILEEIQSKVYDYIKNEWLEQEDFLLEKRSLYHKQSNYFRTKDKKRFSLNKKLSIHDEIFKYSLYELYPIDDFMKNKEQFIRMKVTDIKRSIDNAFYHEQRKIETKGNISDFEKCIKVIFYDLVITDEETLTLEYGIDNVLDNIDNLNYQ